MGPSIKDVGIFEGRGVSISMLQDIGSNIAKSFVCIVNSEIFNMVSASQTYTFGNVKCEMEMSNFL